MVSSQASGKVFFLPPFRAFGMTFTLYGLKDTSDVNSVVSEGPERSTSCRDQVSFDIVGETPVNVTLQGRTTSKSRT